MTPEQYALLLQNFDATHFSKLRPREIARIRSALQGASVKVTVDPESFVAGSDAPTLYAQGHYAACKSRLASKSGLSAPQLSLLSVCGYYNGDYPTSLVAATHLVKLPGYGSEGLYWSILSHQHLAVQNLVKAGETEPDSISIHTLMAETYREMEDYISAEREYQIVLELDPNSFPALLGAAATYLQENSLTPARAMIERALALNTEDPEANYIAAEIDVEERKFDAAEPHLKIALKADERLLPRVHALLGRLYASKGDTARAIVELQQGLIADDDGSVHYQLARIYQRAGRKQEADEMFRETNRLQEKKLRPEQTSDPN
jgi:tetratricopeptide (TPR) repeat protein